MTFRQFAFNNVRRNMRTYASFFLSSIFSVIVFFIYAAFSSHPAIKSGSLKDIAKLMETAEYIIYTFSFLFILYSLVSFIRGRKKEFGILSVLGISSTQLKCLIFFENMVIGIISVITGIFLGLVLTKGFFMLCAKVIDMDTPSFYLPMKAIGITGGAFLFLFILISLLTPFILHKSNVLHLLQADKKPNEQPKASLLFVTISLTSLGYSYYTFLTEGIPKDHGALFLNLGLVIIGTYFFFTQLSVFLIKSLKKRKIIYWRGVRFLWLSDLAYQIKENARLFFLITIISTIAFSSFSGVVVFKSELLQEYESNPIHYTYYYEKKLDPKVLKQVENKLDQANLSYKRISMQYIRFPARGSQFADEKTIMRLSDYNLVARSKEWKVEELEENTAILLFSPKHRNTLNPLNSLKLENTTNIKIKEAYPVSLPVGPFQSYVVSDTLYTQLLKQSKEITTVVHYIIPEWNNITPRRDSIEVAIGNQLTNHIPTIFAKGKVYISDCQSINSLLFVGLFMAILFFLVAGGFLYLRLYTGLEKKQEQYRSLSKIGLTEKEVRKSISTQLIILFFLPFIIAALHTVVGLHTLTKYYDTSFVYQSAFIGIGALALLEIIYFIIIRSRYLAKMRQILV